MTHTPSLHWTHERPGALVVACSDGRLQRSVDDFLAADLGITDYDRLYLPGGPGALAPAGEYQRADVARRELEFLIGAHRLDRIVLLFHGAGADGPDGAACADYRRKLQGRTRDELIARQEQDAAVLIRQINWNGRMMVRAFLAEVAYDRSVRFVELHPAVERSCTP